MSFTLTYQPKKSARTFSHQDVFFLVGSCFTEHIGTALQDLKFPILQNPNGILFDPYSVAQTLSRCISGDLYKEEELFYLNEIWNSWAHHSIFSDIDKKTALEKMNASLLNAKAHLEKTTILIITLGSSYSYRLLNEAMKPVANCHRAPAQWFQKYLMGTDETIDVLTPVLEKLYELNPTLEVIFTVSPVRHIRDGVVENNRSKARLLEAVHTLTEQFERCTYFPAYEIVIDVLRDYRFYDIDFVHPNYLATKFVLEKFSETYFSEETIYLNEELKSIHTGLQHRSRFPETEAHKKFQENLQNRINTLQEKYPFLNL